MKYLPLILMLLLPVNVWGEERCPLTSQSIAHGDACSCNDGILTCWDWNRDKEEPERPINFNTLTSSNVIPATPESQDAGWTVEESESQKWREKCDDQSLIKSEYNRITHKLEVDYSAILYACTRYNAALLEEIKKDKKTP